MIIMCPSLEKGRYLTRRAGEHCDSQSSFVSALAVSGGPGPGPGPRALPDSGSQAGAGHGHALLDSEVFLARPCTVGLGGVAPSPGGAGPRPGPLVAGLPVECLNLPPPAAGLGFGLTWIILDREPENRKRICRLVIHRACSLEAREFSRRRMPRAARP